MKAFFFEEILSSTNFDEFSKWKFFQISAKNLNSEGNKTFSWSDIIWYPLYSKFATFNDFEENPSFFLKKKQIS